MNNFSLYSYFTTYLGLVHWNPSSCCLWLPKPEDQILADPSSMIPHLYLASSNGIFVFFCFRSRPFFSLYQGLHLIESKCRERTHFSSWRHLSSPDQGLEYEMLKRIWQPIDPGLGSHQTNNNSNQMTLAPNCPSTVAKMINTSWLWKARHWNSQQISLGQHFKERI